MTETLSSSTESNACYGGKTAGLRIAVFVDINQLPSAAFEAVCVAVFGKRNGKWAEVESKRIQPLGSQSPEAVTGFIDQMIALAADALAVAGSSIGGKLYTALNKQGKHIFEITDVTPEQLSGIAEDVAMTEAKRSLASVAFERTRPVQTEIDGVYSLDLVTAMEEYPNLSSKMILKPFIKATPFTELTLICHHLPHWLSEERDLEILSKQRGDYLVVTIQQKLCREAIE